MPFWSPDAPIPSTALATISILDEEASPQRREPSSKTEKNATNVHLGGDGAVSEAGSESSGNWLRSSDLRAEMCIHSASHGLERRTVTVVSAVAEQKLSTEDVTYLASWYAAPYQPTSSSEWNSLVRCGIAFEEET
jgi:hypothetical protein